MWELCQLNISVLARIRTFPQAQSTLVYEVILKEFVIASSTHSLLKSGISPKHTAREANSFIHLSTPISILGP